MNSLYPLIIISIIVLIILNMLLLIFALLLRMKTEKRNQLLLREIPFWRRRLENWLNNKQILEPHETEPREFLQFLSQEAEFQTLEEVKSLGLLISSMGLDEYLHTVALKNNEYDKAWAIHLIGLFRLGRYKSLVISNLDATSPLVSYAAALALARILTEEDADYLPLLHKLTSVYSNQWTTEKLGEIIFTMGLRAGRELLPSIVSGAVTGKRLWFYIDLVGEMALPEAGPVLARLLNADKETVVHAIRSIGMVGYSQGRVELEALLDHPEWMIRAQSAKTLGFLKCTQSIPALTAALKDTHWWVRHNAGFALARIGEPGLESLLQISNADSDPYAKEMALLVLSKEGGLKKIALV